MKLKSITLGQPIVWSDGCVIQFRSKIYLHTFLRLSPWRHSWVALERGPPWNKANGWNRRYGKKVVFRQIKASKVRFSTSTKFCRADNKHVLLMKLLLYYRLHCSCFISFPSVHTSLFMFHLISLNPNFIVHVSFNFLQSTLHCSSFIFFPSVHSLSHSFHLP